MKWDTEDGKGRKFIASQRYFSADEYPIIHPHRIFQHGHNQLLLLQRQLRLIGRREIRNRAQQRALESRGGAANGLTDNHSI